MRRFDKFDEQRRALPQTNGLADVEESTASLQTVYQTTISKAPHVSQPLRKANPWCGPSLPARPFTQPRNKRKEESDEEEVSDIKYYVPPTKMKKVEHDSDAAFAVKLQA